MAPDGVGLIAAALAGPSSKLTSPVTPELRVEERF
jgi:hypothetical protein